MIHTLAGALLIGAHLILGGSDCQITGPLYEDGSQHAICVDGSEWWLDSDGQPVPGIANAPVIAPGTWVKVN